jgi:hypothetical protein
VLEDLDQVALREVHARQLLAQKARQVGVVDRERLAIEVAQRLQVIHRLAGRELQLARHRSRRLHFAPREPLAADRMLLQRQRLVQALQAVQALRRLGMGHEGTFSVQLDDQALGLQRPQRLPHGDAAHAVLGGHLRFGRQLGPRRQPAVEDARTQRVAQLRMQRLRKFRHSAT